MFEYKGIKSDLDFSLETKEHFIKTIDYLLEEYGINKLDGIIKLSDNDRPYQLFTNIFLAPSNNNLSDHYKLNFQLSHELSHLIQDHQKRGLHIKIKQLDNGKIEQIPFPRHSIQETEAVANSIDVCENLLKYVNYNARVREDPEYYNYDEAFRLVDSGELSLLRKNLSKNFINN